MKKTSKKKTLNKTFTIVISIIVFFVLFGCGFFYYIYINAPEFNTDLLYKQESSNIYDSQGKLITTIGTEKRQTDLSMGDLVGLGELFAPRSSFIFS